MKTSDPSVLRLTTCLPVIIAGLVWLSLHFLGCQTLVTTNRPPSLNRVEGMLYYLPIGKITIKGDYGKGEPTSRLKSDSGSSTASPTATPGPLTITVAAEVEADETAGVYYVTSIPNYMFEDDVHVTVNQKHLLSAGNVTTEDKTAEIVAAVASLVAGRTFLQRAEEKAEPFDFSFHPSCPDEVDFVTRQLWRRGIGLTVDTEAGPSVCAKRSRGFGKELEEAAREFSQQGLLFRPGVSYKIRLVAPVTPGGEEPATTESWAMKNTQQFILPDPTRLYAIEYSRVAFVKKVRNVGFKDGMLTDFQQHLPSPVLGFLGIPKAIIQAMVPIPAATDAGSGSTSGTNPPKN